MLISQEMIEVECNPDDYLPSENFKISLPALEERGYKKLKIIGLASSRGENAVYVNNVLLRELMRKNATNIDFVPIDTPGFHKWLEEYAFVLGLPFYFRQRFIKNQKVNLKRALKCLFRK